MKHENKNTCGECKWFVLNSEGRCRSNEGEENANNDCCSFFEPKVITNGDKIRQMSNKEIREHLHLLMDCPDCPVVDKCKTIADCKKNLLAWLNAPAESEGEE